MSSESGETVEKNFAFHPIPREKKGYIPSEKNGPKDVYITQREHNSFCWMPNMNGGVVYDETLWLKHQKQ